YSLSGDDAALLDINAVTGVVTLKASADYETKSSYSFNVIATDNGAGNLNSGSLSTTQAVTVSVNDLNDNAPTVSAGMATATIVEAGGVDNAIAGTSSASIQLTKADVDTVGRVSYDTAYLLNNGWSTTDGGLSYSKNGVYGTAKLTLATDTVSYVLSNNSTSTQALTIGQSVTDGFSIQVSDGNATQVTDAVFNIVGSNDAPVAASSAVPPLTAISGQDFAAVTLPANLFTDLDNGETSNLVWRVENLPTGMVFDANTHIISGKPVGGFEGVNTLQVIATDPNGAERTVAVTLTIVPAPVNAPEAPVFTPAPPVPTAPVERTPVSIDLPATRLTSLPTGTIASVQGASGFAADATIGDGFAAPVDNANINTGSAASGASNSGPRPAPSVTTSSVSVDVGADGRVQVTPASGVAANTTGLSIANMIAQSDRVSISIADSGSASNYSATLADGSTLPSWVQVDPVTGEVSMTPPPGQGKIALKINAVDTNGNTRVLEVNLDLDQLPTPDQGEPSEPTSANGVTFMSLDEQLNQAAGQLDDYGRDLMKLLVS
uniref:putative Ig domain-containing protein n=1 Tax=Marinomonas lutimaris TaxID=2846746 RepID=UPI001CA5289B